MMRMYVDYVQKYVQTHYFLTIKYLNVMLKKVIYTITCLMFLAISLTTSLRAQSTIYALTTANELISFSSSNPMSATSAISITGLAIGQELVGFDSRPRTGELYALGYNAAAGTGRLYKLSFSGILTALGSSDIALNLGMATNNIGMDFNPTVDRIRIVSTNGKNYRLHPDLGTLVATDTDLSYGAGDPNQGMTPVVGQIAYTNSYVASTKTVLYYLDESNGVWGSAFVPSNPNNGQISSVGSTGLNFNPLDKTIDVDIAFTGTSNVVYLVANTNVSINDDLYTINPSTGSATMVGSIGTGVAIKDIAVMIDRTVPPLIGTLVYGLTTHAAPRIVSFDATNPNVIRTDFAITGLKAGQTIAGMDMRPQDRQVYALGVNATVPTDTNTTIYTLNVSTGVATIFADSVKMNLGGINNITVDFNPVANRLRVISGNNDRNYRLNLTLSPVVVVRDAMLNYASGDANLGVNPLVAAGAYTNNYACATTTQLFDIETQSGVLSLQNPPNNGVLNTIASLGLMLDPSDYSMGFDIFTHNQGGSPVNTTYLAANIMGGNNFDSLYMVNLTGGTMAVGRIGNGLGIKDIAVAINPLPTAMLTASNSPICSGNSAVFTLTGTPGSVVTYNINGGSNATITLTGVTANVTIVNATNNKTLNLVSVTDGFCGQNLTGNLTVTVNPFMLPPANITPSGSTTFCSDSPITLNANPGMVNYVWRRGNTVVQSGASSSYIPTASGNHNVIVTDTNNCNKTSAIVMVVRNLAPSINAGADKMVCDGSSVQIGGSLTTTNSYSWSPSIGLSNPMIAKPIATPTGNMTYILYAINNANGCMRSDTMNIVTLPLPPMPSISAMPNGNSTILTASSPNAVSINWYKNGLGFYGNKPANSSLNVYNSNPTNAYTVRSKGSNGCLSMPSMAINVRLGEDKEGDALITFEESIMKAYPNPTQGRLNVEIVGGSEGKIVLYNTLGQVMIEKNVSFSTGKNIETLDISNLNQGVYSLVFYMKGFEQVEKIVKE